MCECDKGRELFAEMMEIFTDSDASVNQKLTVAKAGITYFSELLRMAYPGAGEAIALEAASVEKMAEVEKVFDGG